MEIVKRARAGFVYSEAVARYTMCTYSVYNVMLLIVKIEDWVT